MAIWLYATRSTGTAEVLDRLKKQAAIFGNPRRIISDRGTAFTSKEFETYCEEENIEHILITIGVPRGNGQVESVNQTLTSVLMKLTTPNSPEWLKYLMKVQQYLNSLPHGSIGSTPFNVLFGTNMRLKDKEKIQELIESEWIAAFQKNRNKFREDAKKNIRKIQCENTKNFNKRRKEAHFSEDDLIAIKQTQTSPGSKFALKFLGSYRISKVLRNDRYLVTKVGDYVGPQQTSTSADRGFIKPWVSNIDSDESDETSENQAGRPSVGN